MPGCLAITSDKQKKIFNKTQGELKPAEIEPAEGLNVYKSFIKKIDGFDMNEFPFLIVTGNSQIQLVNVKTNKVLPLVNRNNQTFFGQAGAVVLSKFTQGNTLESMKCLYTTQRLNSAGMRQYRLHEMQLFSDFVSTLREMGKIPKVTLKQVKKLSKEKMAAQKQKDEKLEKLKELLKDPEKSKVLRDNPIFKELMSDEQFKMVIDA